MNTYLHDGNTFDLDRVFLDVTGVEWVHTGEWADSEPLLRSVKGPGGFHDDAPVPLATVYRDHGPLLTLPGPIPPALRRAAIESRQVAA